MKTLYIIPVLGTSNSLPLTGNGVDVSLSGGLIAAKLATKAPTGTTKKFSLTTGQGTIYYDDTNVSLEVIGIWDMEVGRASYPLSMGLVVNIRVEGNYLVFTS